MNGMPGASLETVPEQRPLPAPKALRYALQLASDMRSMHENGNTPPSAPTTLDSYAAPELRTGSLPDVRSDIYRLGAITYHLLTGDLPSVPLTPTGDLAPGLDAFLSRCLDPNPDRRWQTMRIACMELKLLSAAANRLSDAWGARPASEPSLRDRISRLESAVETLATTSEDAIATLRSTVNETREYVKTAFEFVEDRLRDQAVLIETVHASARNTAGSLEQMSSALSACHQAASDARRVADEASERVGTAVQPIDRRIEELAGSIESLHTVAERTDDLLERVVESIDSLQNFVLERTGDLRTE